MFKPHLILTNPHGIYLRRWFMTPWSADDHPRKAWRLPNIYLHNMQQSDDDRALHDHPWDNMSIVLWGGYIEHVFERPPVEGLELPRVIQKRRRMGSIIRRKAEDAHRLELHESFDSKVTRYARATACVSAAIPAPTVKLKPCWTIFITWRKRREWGFWAERNGVIGEQPVQRADDHLVLTHYGKVAQWIHQQTFLARLARADKGMA